MAGEIRVEYCYTWKIENYSMFYRKHKVSLRSPIFSPNNIGGSKWYLEFYPLGRKNKEYKSCVLSRSDEDLGAEEISIAFKIEVLNESGNIFATRGNDSSKYEFKRGIRLGWDDLPITDWKEDNITIRCRIISFLPAVSEAVTEVEIERCSFNWTVDLNHNLVDPVTRRFSFSKASWYEIAVTFPNEKIEIKICKLEQNTVPKLLCGKISLLNNLGVKVLSQMEKHLFDTSGDGIWDYPSFILRSELELEDNKYVKNGAFSLFCDFSEANGNEQSRTIRSIDSYYTTKLNNIITLHSDLKNIFSKMKYSDVELRTENVILPAHKSVLSARSPVFSVMFDQDMVENKLDTVDIIDVDLATMQSFLEFLYTGTVKFEDWRSALKLLMTAEKYQVLSLKETCSEYLIPSLSVENVCEILGVADMVNLKKLKKCTLNYIAKHITDILNSSEWSEFIKTNAELSTEIFSYFATHFELKPKKN